MVSEERKTTTRGLIETDIGPLRRFTGVLDSISSDTRTYGEGEKTRESVIKGLNFKDIDVKEAVEPYHYPVYTVSAPLSNRKKSRWGVLSDGTPGDRTVGFNHIADMQYSADQLNPESPSYIKPTARMDIENAIGMRIGMVMTDGLEGRPPPADLYDGRADRGVGADVATPAWTVYEIEGIGAAGGGAGVSALDVAMTVLDGLSLADFNKAALDNPTIRSDIGLLQSISMPPSAPNSFVNAMIVAGKFTRDDQGIHHRVWIV